VIELLIVTSILALVIGAVGACLISGLRVWEIAADFNTVESEALIGLEMMEKDLMNSYVFHGIAFDGRSAQVSFPGSTCESEDIGQSATECRKIGTVRYLFNEKEKRLSRKVWAYPSLEPEGLETVVKNLDGLELSYFSVPSDGDAVRTWKDTWESETNLPDGLRIEMVFHDEKKEVRFRRLVMLPGSR
jgi:type II secretory pathway component PulJ